MTPDCIPFSAIPHTTALFNDFLLDFQKVKQFYPRPFGTEWMADEARRIRYDDARRARVADVLERQNRGWGAGQASLDAIERFRRGAVAIVTGQQVGLLGGPLYSLLKAASVLRVARDLTDAGTPAVPIFWLATEDHDLEEVNHTVIPAGSGELKSLSSQSRGKANAPVGEVRFGEDIGEIAKAAAALFDNTEVSNYVLESYRPGESFGSAFARLFARVFSAHGLILLDPIDSEFHQVAAPVLRAAAEQAIDIDHALLERGKQLREAGYHEQVKVTPASTLLFSIAGGERQVIHLANGGFVIGAEKVEREELLRRIDEHPEHFSPNVLLRPVVQDYLLPTVAYFGGAAELAYFAQAAVVYERLLERVTPIQPRFSATVVDGRMQRLLKRYQLTLTDLFHGAERLRETLATRMLPPPLQHDFEAAQRTVEHAIGNLRSSLQKLDPTLVDAAERAGRKMQYQVRRLQTRAARAEIRRNEQLTRDTAELLAQLFPNKVLQEREIAGVYFLARHGLGLLDRLIEQAGNSCSGHQVVYL